MGDVGRLVLTLGMMYLGVAALYALSGGYGRAAALGTALGLAAFGAALVTSWWRDRRPPAGPR